MMDNFKNLLEFKNTLITLGEKGFAEAVLNLSLRVSRAPWLVKVKIGQIHLSYTSQQIN